MACSRRRSITLSQIKRLATNYAIDKQVDVIVYSCTDYNFCVAEKFNSERFKPIMKIFKDGSLFVYPK